MANSFQKFYYDIADLFEDKLNFKITQINLRSSILKYGRLI